MSGRIKDFFRVTASQHRGLVALTVLLAGLVAVLYVKETFFSANTPPVVTFEHADVSRPGSYLKDARKDTVFPFDPSTADSAVFVSLGFSPRQARTIINYRTSLGGRFRSAEQFSKSYAVSDSMFERLRPYIRIQEKTNDNKPTDYSVVDINRASLKRLKAHSAFGDTLSEKIFRARVRYGGFVCLEQMCGVFKADSARLCALSQYMKIDTSAIVKYDVNVDNEPLLAQHPYISRPFARTITGYRDAHGHIENFDTLRTLKYFPASKEKYLRFYLNFDRR